MPIKQTYAQHGDACATAHAMEILGDRWTYPVLREVLLGPKRFGELTGSVRGVTPAVLTTRLREMERTGLIRRMTLPPPAGVAVYDATAWARDLTPILQDLGRWAQASPTRDLDVSGLTPDAAVQSMLTMAPTQPADPPIELAFHLWDARQAAGEGYRYDARWGDELTIRRIVGEPLAQTTIHADSSTWTAILYDGGSLADAQIEGTREPAERFVGAFQASPR